MPAPRVLALGKIEGWPYLVQSRAAGVPAQSVWRKLSLSVRRGLVGEIGALLRRLHDHPPPEGLDSDWESFLQARLEGAEGHHCAQEPWSSWIRSRLQEFIEPPLPHVFLHADLTADHFLLARREDGSWFVSGIIDFCDARIGHPFYDFIAVIADYTLGEPELSCQLLEAYGLERSSEVEEGLLSFCLLHEFGRLQDFLDAHPMKGPADFRRALWGKENEKPPGIGCAHDREERNVLPRGEGPADFRRALWGKENEKPPGIGCAHDREERNVLPRGE